MTEQTDGQVELADETEAHGDGDGKVEASAVAEIEATEEVELGGADRPDETVVADTVGADEAGAEKPGRIAYACGLSAQGVRELLIDINYRNMGRVGYEADDQKFIERFIEDKDVIAARSRPAIRHIVLDKVAQGAKSGHPRGR